MIGRVTYNEYFQNKGCHRNVVSIIVNQIPLILRWFIRRWLACKNENDFIRKYLPSCDIRIKFSKELIKEGLLPLAKWGSIHGCFSFDVSTQFTAIQYGQLTFLKYLRGHHCVNMYTLINCAQFYNQSDIEQWLLQDGIKRNL